MEPKLKNIESGMSMLYVLAALIVTGFVSTALLKISSSDRISNVNYSTSATARSAALSGIIAAIAELEENTASTVVTLQRWVNNPTNSPEEISTGTLGDLSYTVDLLAFDSETFNVTLKAEGIGRANSRASVVSVYHLDGLDYELQRNWDDDNALHVEDGVSINFKGPIEVNGGIRLSSSSDFDAYARGSVFNGTFRSEDATSSMVFKGLYTFNDNAYFGTKPYLQNGTVGDPSVRFGKFVFGADAESGFPTGAKDANDNKEIDVDKPSYIFGASSGVSYSEINFVTAPNTSSDKNEMLESLGFDLVSNEITIHPEVIPSQLINPVNSINTNKINNNSTTHDYKEWHGFIVLETASTFTVGSSGGISIAAGKKVILLVKHQIEMTANQSLFSVEVDEKTDPTDPEYPVDASNSGHFTVIVMSGGKVNNFGGWDEFRGLYYRLDGKMIIGGSANIGIRNLYGAVYAKNSGSNNLIQWYPQNNQSGVLTYDPTVYEDLDLVGDMVNGNKYFLTRSDDAISGVNDGKTLVASTIEGSLVSQSM